jgi:DNA-binding MarR family transcriptional regulator
MEFNYGFFFEKTGKQIKQALQRRFSQHAIDLTVDQWVILYELYTRGMQNQVDLCAHVYKDAPTVTRIVELLEKKAWIHRKASSQDRRRFDIHLTPVGKALVKKLLPDVIEFRNIGWKGLSAKDIQNLQRITRQIEKNLEHAA